MNMFPGQPPSSSHLGAVFTDLMTSVAVVFILLFAAMIAQASSKSQTPPPLTEDPIRKMLRNPDNRSGLTVEKDPQDPSRLVVVVPESHLTFAFGQSTLSPKASRFLEEVMPFYAETLCGTLHEQVESFTIQGHTDDRGDDIYNLQLSQERSLAVMIKALRVIQTKTPSAYECFKKLAATSGRGKEELIYQSQDNVNQERSRRVVFKIRLRLPQPDEKGKKRLKGFVHSTSRRLVD